MGQTESRPPTPTPTPAYPTAPAAATTPHLPDRPLEGRAPSDGAQHRNGHYRGRVLQEAASGGGTNVGSDTTTALSADGAAAAAEGGPAGRRPHHAATPPHSARQGDAVRGGNHYYYYSSSASPSSFSRGGDRGRPSHQPDPDSSRRAARPGRISVAGSGRTWAEASLSHSGLGNRRSSTTQGSGLGRHGKRRQETGFRASGYSGGPLRRPLGSSWLGPPPPLPGGVAAHPIRRLPSTRLRRHRQRRLSSATTSSVGSPHPRIEVTNYSDAETDVDFDPEPGGGGDGEPPKYPTPNGASTPNARRQDMDRAVPNYEAASVSDEFRGRQSASSGRESGRATATSNVSSRVEGSSASGKKERKNSAQLRIKRGIIGQNDPKNDAVNKWKNIVSEFEQVYSESEQSGKAAEKSKSKEARRVNKLTNLDQYDNVRQVFNKSMPLPMQMAPPGGRAADMEAESAASERAMYGQTWSLMTPMGRDEAISQAEHQLKQSGSAAHVVGMGVMETTRSKVTEAEELARGVNYQVAKSSNYQGNTALNASSMLGSRPSSRSASSKSGSRTSSRQSNRSRSNSRASSRHQSLSSSHAEMQKQVASAAVRRKQSLATSSSAHSSSAQSSAFTSAAARSGSIAAGNTLLAVGQAGVRHSSIVSESVTEIVERRNAPGAKAAMMTMERQAAKAKGVKFSHKRIDKQAAIIVDEAIQGAISLFYGRNNKHSKTSSRSSARSSSAFSSSLHSMSQSEEAARVAAAAARNASGIVRKQHVEEHIEEHIYHRKSLAAAADANASQRSLSGSKAMQSAAQLTQQQLQLPQKVLQQQLKPRSSKDISGMYDMVIQPKGEPTQAEKDWNRTLKENKKQSCATTNTTTSIKVYPATGAGANPPPIPQYMAGSSGGSAASTLRRTVVDPPTITRGTVTRVFHELDGQGGHAPPEALLAQLHSLEEPALEGDYSLDYDYTWPADDTHTLTSEAAYRDQPWGPTSRSDPWVPGSSSGPQSVLLGNVPGGYIDDTIALSPPQPQSPAPPEVSYTMTSFKSQGGSDPAQLSPNVGMVSRVLRSLPIVLPQNGAAPRHDDSYLSLPAILESGSFNSGAYSNEPLIVADLLAPAPAEHSHSLDSCDPQVNMNRSQVLNFYVFNQKQQNPEPGMPRISYAATDVQAKHKGEEVQVKHIYFGDEEMKQMVSQASQVAVPEPEMPKERKYTIYHKQTQTLPLPIKKPSPSPSPPLSAPPSPAPQPRLIERKQEMVIKRVAPPAPSPEPPVVHREIHHYVTKERQIEKLPPPPVPKSEFSVQTEMTGRDWEDEVDSLHRALNTARRRALEAEQAMDEMHTSNAAIQSVVREIEEVAQQQERLPTPPPISMEIVKVTPEPELEPKPKPEEEDEEDEFYEWTEIEEREQRLSMTIFEEIEFNMQRTQGGQTSTESGKTSELVPWAIPSKYEAVVDKRRQKMTQVRDVHREGDDILVQAGNIPALTQRLSVQKLMGAVDVPDSGPASGVDEHREVTLKRQKNVTGRPARARGEHNIKINRGPQTKGADWPERHSWSANLSPKREYMNTFEHAMDRSRALSPRARGRTSVRSDTHIPLAAMEAASRHSASVNTELAKRGTGLDSSGAGHSSSTVVRKSRGADGWCEEADGGVGRYSTTIVRDTGGGVGGRGGGASGGSNAVSGVDVAKRFTTIYNRDSPMSGGAETSRHSTTYLAEPKGLHNAPLGGGASRAAKEHHVTTYTRQMKGVGGEGGDASNSSGYSSADNTSQMRAEKLRGFEIPFGPEDTQNTRYYTEADVQLSRPGVTGVVAVPAGGSGPGSPGSLGRSSRRFVSRFDPGNVYFTVPQWAPVESSELLYSMTNSDGHRADGPLAPPNSGNFLPGCDQDNDSLPDTLPSVEAEIMRQGSVLTRSENQQSPRKVSSQLVQDEDGTMTRITTTEQKMTKKMDYVSAPSPSPPPLRISDEALGEESFVELDLTTTEHISERPVAVVAQSQKKPQKQLFAPRPADEEAVSVEEVVTHTEQVNEHLNMETTSAVTTGSSSAAGQPQPEVIAETSVGFKRIEYADQERSMGLGTDDEVGLGNGENRYDMRTATLRPVRARDANSRSNLMNYALGETMVTEL